MSTNQDEIYQQGSLFSLIYETKHIKKPIRLIEFFAGIGAQFKALKQVTKNVEHYKICEWAYNSILSYNAIHIKDFKDYSKDKSKEEMIERIKGISINYNEPLTDEQLSKKSIEWIRSAYNNIIATNNLVNIMQVHGKDLEIVDTDKYEYILTYSFPCQDLSLAGLRKGMDVSQADGGTRSGLLWEVERILTELEREREKSLPQILVMENVPEVIGSNNIANFQKWERRLSELGYQNYTEILNGRDYGIPQNRRRCFMVSILGDYAYEFPMRVALKYKLKNFLEKQADEKYYLSKSHIERISQWKAQQDPLKDIEKEKEVSPTLTARGAGEDHSGMVLVSEEDLFKDNEIVDVDSSDEFRREHNNEVAPTLVAHPKFGVAEKPLKEELCDKLIEQGKVKENDVIRHSYTNNRLGNGDKNMNRVESKENNICPTLDTRCDCLGVVTKDDEKPSGGGVTNSGSN